MLIPAIFAAAFLALAVTAFTLAVRSHVRIAATELATAEASALADAGVQLALADLINALAVRGWRRTYPADGRAYACSLGGGRIVVAVTDEAGRVDLNTASEEMLRSLIAGLGAAPEDARRLAAAIADWRDRDDEKRPDGAEAGEYREAGRQAGPKNAPFEAVEELAQVLGMDGRLLARLTPLVTVYSSLPGIDRTKAPAGLVAALIEGAALTAFSSGAGGSVRPGGLGQLPPAFAQPSPQRVFRIRAEASGTRGALLVREAVVRVGPARQRLYAVLAWRRESIDASRTEPPVELGDC